MPVLTSNWRFECTRQRAHTRCIVISFFEHSDEPNATALYEELNTSRDEVSASVGEIVTLCSAFESSSAQQIRSEQIFPQVSVIFSHAHARFKTTMTAFMYFFLEVSCSMIGHVYVHIMHGQYRKCKHDIIIHFPTLMQLSKLSAQLLTEEQCWDFAATHSCCCYSASSLM